MATPWDRPSPAYLAEWVPRFAPYHRDLVDELALGDTDRALVVSSGTGAEAVALAREVGAERLRATDPDPVFVAATHARLMAAGFGAARVDRAPAEDVSGGPYDAIVCAFGMWQLADRPATLRAWAGALGPQGKVAVLTWGPPEASDPVELFLASLYAREPQVFEEVDRPALRSPRIDASRDAMEAMFGAAGLVLVRHTVVRHTLSFPSAEAFVAALHHARAFDQVLAELGPVRAGLVAAHFYEQVGGAEAPIPWDPPATLAVAARPGTEVKLQSRSSIRVPR